MNNVMNAFDEAAFNYDKQRKSLIPCFDEFYDVLLDLAESKNEVRNILDLGAGTGLMTNFLLKKFPNAKYTLIDFSEEMLNIAKRRFQRLTNISYIKTDYRDYKFNNHYDVIISALSIHHLKNAEKKQLYAKIYEILEFGGVFINGDQFLVRSLNNENTCHEHCKNKIEKTELAEDEKQSAYERMKHDKPATIEDHFNWLEEPGFIDIHLFYKYYNFGIIRGKK